MLEKIEALLAEIDSLQANSAEDIENLRIKYLSKKGSIPALMADFRKVPAEQKKEVGIRINELKTKAFDKINSLKAAFDSADTDTNDIDITRTAYPIQLGTRHPLTMTSSHVSGSHWLKVPKSRTTGMCSEP